MSTTGSRPARSGDPDARVLGSGAAPAFLLATLIAFAGAAAAEPQGLGGGRRSEKASLSVVADRTAYQTGEPVRLALVLSIEPGWHVNSHQPTFEYLIPTTATVTPPSGWGEPEMRYPPGVMKVFAFEDQPLSVYDGDAVIEARLTVPDDITAAGVAVETSVRYQACDDRKCLPPVTTRAVLDLSIGPGGEPVKNMPVAAPVDPGGPGSAEGASASAVGGSGREGPPRRMLAFVLLGLVGGLLLNAMPCVLPVLSLKVLGLVKSSAEGRRNVTIGALATLAGIVFSFWMLAAAAVAAQWLGATVGWGVQFQQPTFVVFLTFVVILFCLNLWGLFEVPLPASVANWADSAGGSGLLSHFTAGLFATLLATPCSAPFLGTAVGFALSQPAATIFVIFTAVGLGMALPYLAIAIVPSSVRLLPRPGAWMGAFRVFMGFLLAAAAVWLLYVLSSQVSRERLAFIELSILALAFFVWMRHAGRGVSGRLASAGTVGAILAGILLATTAGAAPERSATADQQVGRIDWVRFDRAKAEDLAARGRLVFVDVTADWCFTCKVNERLALETPEVAAAFERNEVVPMKADWTNRDDSISDFLNDHGRYGIPFYLLYRPGDAPHLFGELITKETVVAVVDAAGGRIASAGE